MFLQNVFQMFNSWDIKYVGILQKQLHKQLNTLFSHDLISSVFRMTQQSLEQVNI